MRIRLTLKPGHHGTRKLVRKYAGLLVCVRYRYDEARRVRLKTVELVEEELPWVPRLPRGRDRSERVLVRIGYEEAELRVSAKNAGARWQPDRKLWEMPIGAVYAMGLDQRIVS